MVRGADNADMGMIGDLLAARERADEIEPGHWRHLVLDQWQGGDFDLAADAVVADDGRGELAGFAALLRPGGFVAVHPEREGEGIGTLLRRWLEQRASDQGRAHHRQTAGARNANSRTLLEAAGYQHVRSYLQMEKHLDAPRPVVRPPAGVELATPDPERDAHKLHAFDELAFAENADFQRHSFEQFVAEHLRTLDPEHSAVALRDGELIGMALCQRRTEDTTLVDLLAVAPLERGTGLARALLFHAYAASTRAGARRAILFVASDNARAVALYQRAGMVEVHRADVFEKPVGSRPAPGRGTPSVRLEDPDL